MCVVSPSCFWGGRVSLNKFKMIINYQSLAFTFLVLYLVSVAAVFSQLLYFVCVPFLVFAHCYWDGQGGWFNSSWHEIALVVGQGLVETIFYPLRLLSGSFFNCCSLLRWKGWLTRQILGRFGPIWADKMSLLPVSFFVVCFSCCTGMVVFRKGWARFSHLLSCLSIPCLVFVCSFWTGHIATSRDSEANLWKNILSSASYCNPQTISLAWW